MGARIGYGAAWGALPATGAIAAGVDGNAVLAIVLAVVTVIASLIVPLAPFLPGLHKLPFVGSPRLTATFRLNGSRDMRITGGMDQTCILEVGIRNPERWAEVKDAWINVLIPSGLKVGRCTQTGERLDAGGSWEEFHRHQLGTHPRSDFWNDAGWNFPPRLSRVIRFKLRLGDPGVFPVLLKFAAPSLYDEIDQPATIYVDEGQPGLDDRIGHLITRGERLHREFDPIDLEGDFRHQAMVWFADASPVLEEAVGDEPLPQTPQGADSTELDDSLPRLPCRTICGPR